MWSNKKKYLDEMELDEDTQVLVSLVVDLAYAEGKRDGIKEARCLTTDILKG